MKSKWSRELAQAKVPTTDFIHEKRNLLHEIKNILSEQLGKKICGRFTSNQLEEKIIEETKIEIPFYLLNKNLSYTKRFIIALLLVFGTTLFSCNYGDGRTVGDIVIVPSENVNGKIAVKTQDSTKSKVRNILGDTIYSSPKQELKGKVKVEKCTMTTGDLKIEHTKGEMKIKVDTLKAAVPKDTVREYKMMGMVKREK